MPRSQSLVALFLLGAAAVAAAGLGSVLADAAQSARPVTGEQSKQEVADKTIRELIKLLGDDFYEAREAAAKRLAAIGEPALKLLENAALASKDAEVRQRADSLALQISQPRFFFISLASKANLKLADSLGNLAGNNVGNLPKGISVYAKKWFKVEDAVVQLSGTRVKNNRPEKVEAIQVKRGLARLHILHGTSSGGEGKPGDPNFVADGTLIGEYTIHYADGAKAVMPIEYGQDVAITTTRTARRPSHAAALLGRAATLWATRFASTSARGRTQARARALQRLTTTP